MFKKITIGLLITAVLIHLSFGLLDNFTTRIQSLAGFRDVSERLVAVAGLLILGMCIHCAGNARDEEKANVIVAPQIWHWMMGFAPLLILLVAFTGYVNPHARFPWKFHPFAYSTIHSDKMKLLKEQEESPAIVILGSSRAFTMPADYIEGSIGKPTFNMSVTSASPLDLYAMGNYAIRNTSSPPRLFLVEVLGRGLVNNSNRQDNMPLELLGYLPLRAAGPIINSMFLDTLSLDSLSDAMYLWLGFEVKNKVVHHFAGDGTAVFNELERSRNITRQSLVVYNNNYSCNKLNEDGKAYIEKLVDLSKQNGIFIVFYRSPLNIEFYNILNSARLKRFRYCAALVDAYFKKLVDKNPNMLYLNLTDYEPVSQLGFDGFIDSHHPDSEAAKMIVDKLHPYILEGLNWVEDIR